MRKLPSAPTWSFPPRPWTSHVRAIAPSHTDPNLVVVGIGLGGIVRSTDGGESWQDQRPGAQADCHSLAAHRGDPGLLYEAGGGGFAISRDFGDGWEAADEGMDLRCAWGMAVDAEDPTLVYASAASSIESPVQEGRRKARTASTYEFRITKIPGLTFRAVLGAGRPQAHLELSFTR